MSSNTNIQNIQTLTAIYEVVQNKFCELSENIHEIDLKECEQIKKVLESLCESINKLNIKDKCAFLEAFTKDIDYLVANRQGLTKHLKVKVKAVEHKFLPCVKGLESIKASCSESISKEILENPEIFENEEGDIFFKHGSVVVKEGAVKRTYTITDIKKVPAKFLQINEEAVEKYVNVLGEAPEGIDYTETRSCSFTVRRAVD